VAIAAREPLTLAAPTSPTPREASEPLAPLSTFSAAAKHERSVRASVEIDELAWPKACCDILEHAARGWDRFADDLCERLTRGGQCIAIASRAPGDGRTTVVLAAAKHLAARGIRTLVVEANFERPNLAQCCRITPQAGWADVVDGDRSLDEVLIVAVADGVALLPWQSRGREAAMPGDTVRVTATFETLKDQYDLVLLDTAPLASPAATTAFAALADAARVDAVYMISDARATAIGQLEGVCANLRQAGLTVDGIIENFADPTELGGGRMRVKLHELAGRIFAARE
jgi:Mrp family chromosome partitioning ATPase